MIPQDTMLASTMRSKTSNARQTNWALSWWFAGTMPVTSLVKNIWAWHLKLHKRIPTYSFYAYTKIADVATAQTPPNFIINFSSGSKRGQEKKIEFHKAAGNVVKQGVTVPKDMFYDLIARNGVKLNKDAKGRTQFKDQASLDQFKQRLAQTYNVNIDSIITYDQMMATPVGNTPKWNVIVQPGAGDRAANRRDVIDSYLMFH